MHIRAWSYRLYIYSGVVGAYGVLGAYGDVGAYGVLGAYGIVGDIVVS